MKTKGIYLISLLALLCSCSPELSSSGETTSCKGCVSVSEDFSSNQSLDGSSFDNSSFDISSIYESDGTYHQGSIESIFNQTPQTTSSDEFFELFDIESVVSIKLEFSQASLKFISEHQGDSDNKYWWDAYLPADMTLTLNGETYTYNDVGVRMKGNTSRKNIYNGDSISNYVHYKVKFNVTFDEDIYSTYDELKPFNKTYSSTAEKTAIEDRTLFGLKKLDLKYLYRNSSYGDNTSLKEIYAYSSFSSNGLLAPLANAGCLTVTDGNSSLIGDYELIEPIDKTFLKRRFSKADAQGDLYKCVYNNMGKADLVRSEAVETGVYDSNGYDAGSRIAYGKIGVEDNFAGYVPIYQLKTNDDDGEDSDFSAMANYINAIHSITYLGASQSLLTSVLNVDYFLRFSAVSYLLGNFDDQRYNYNNYYIYFLPSTGQAIYIPYDWDWCLGLDGGNKINDKKVSELTPFDEHTLDGNEACSVYYDTFFKSDKNSQKLSYDRSTYQSNYLDYVKAYSSNVLDSDAYKDMEVLSPLSTNETNNVNNYMSSKLTVITD